MSIWNEISKGMRANALARQLNNGTPDEEASRFGAITDAYQTHEIEGGRDPKECADIRKSSFED